MCLIDQTQTHHMALPLRSPLRSPLSQQPSIDNNFGGDIVPVKSLKDILYEEDVEALQNLLSNDPNALKKSSRTKPLLLASKIGNSKIISLLCANGADIYEEDDRRRLALHIALIKNHSDCVQILLDVHKAKNLNHSLKIIARPEENGKKPILLAANNSKSLQHLLNAAVDLLHCQTRPSVLLDHLGVDEVGVDGFYPIHIAASSGSVESVKIFLSIGANCNVRTEQSKNERSSGSIGMTPLMLAAQEGHLNVCKALVSSTGNILINNANEASDVEKKTALHFAFLMGHYEIADFLIKEGNADSTLKDSSGCVAADYDARQRYRNETIYEEKKQEELSVVQDLLFNLTSTINEPTITFDVKSPPPTSPREEEERIANKKSQTFDYLKEPVQNEVLAILLPHVEKALIHFTKKYEQAAINDLKDFELNCGVHPVDFIASYILRHKNSNQ